MEVDVSAPDMTGRNERQLVSFVELTAGHDKVKMPVQNEPCSDREGKVYKLQILGHPKGGGA